VISNEFFTIAGALPRGSHKVCIVEDVVIIPRGEGLVSPVPVEVRPVIATRRLAKALQEDMVSKYLTCIAFQPLNSY
jgi:hypothetical protein